MGIYGKRVTLFKSYQKIFTENIPNIVNNIFFYLYVDLI